MEKKVACLTGHRPKSLPWGYNEEEVSCKVFKEDCEQIFENAIKYGVNKFLTGMAEGFDIIATEILLKLKKKYSHINIVAVIPCKNQEIKWQKAQQKRYREILEKCDSCVVLFDNYTKTCMNDRNKYMVLNSEFCIACWNGKPSGTGNTVKFAKENNCRVRLIDLEKYFNL